MTSSIHLSLAAALGVPSVWDAIAWTAGLAIAPGFLSAAPFLWGSLRRREAWWLMSPRRAERRVDPRCNERAWIRLLVYAALLFVPGLLLGLLLAWTVVGIVVAGCAAASIAVAWAVRRDSTRLQRIAWLPAVYGAALLVAGAYWVVALAFTAGASVPLVLWSALAGPWLIAQAVLGWQILIAHRAQDGARRIARAAFDSDRALWLV